MDKRATDYFIATLITVVTTGVTSGSALAGGLLAVDFDDGNFDPASMTIISNPYWPLSPDINLRTFTYIGGSDDECVINTISIDPSNVKSDFEGDYEDISAQVVLDQEWVVELGDDEECDASTPTDDDDLTELTFDWYAQDIYLNIWYMGEASRGFEDDCPSLIAVPLNTAREDWPSDELFLECTEGSWEAGQPGQEEGEIIGEAGIVVPSDTPFGLGNGDPLTPGTYYMQEEAEGAEDMAKILRQDARLSVEDGVLPGEYEQCRDVKEWTALEPGASVEHKWYCSDGAGLVLIQGIGGGPTENEVLVEVTISAP